MWIKRFCALFPTVLIAILTINCSDRTETVAPVEPQFAKKIKPPPAEPALEEFWVYRDASSGCQGEIIHIVVSGQYEYIGTAVAHDHFFNGVRDTGFHFEYGFRGPEYPETEWNSEGTEGHVDVCFKGEQIDHIYGDGSGGLRYFVDFPATAAGDDGADPFAISIGAVIDGDGPHFEGKSFRPEGVVDDGVPGAPEASGGSSAWHPGMTFDGVRSYAVWKSGPPLGYLYFQEITLTAASCQVSTEVLGRGKNKTEVTRTIVTADVSLDFEADDLPDTGLIWNQDFWGEGHLRILAGDGTTLHLTSGFRTRSNDGSEIFTVSLEGDYSGQTLGIEFLADFLIAQTAAEPWAGDNVFDYVYDPGRNAAGLLTTAGFDGSLWSPGSNVSRTIHDQRFPVAHSERVFVTCGAG